MIMSKDISNNRVKKKIGTSVVPFLLFEKDQSNTKDKEIAVKTEKPDDVIKNKSYADAIREIVNEEIVASDEIIIAFGGNINKSVEE